LKALRLRPSGWPTLGPRKVYGFWLTGKPQVKDGKVGSGIRFPGIYLHRFYYTRPAIFLKFPSFHLFDQHQLNRLRQGCLLINAARGEVIDNAALLDVMNKRPDLHIFLDTWENEPRIDRKLLTRVDLATPHIAGYSVEGRLRGTQMMLDAACAHFAQSATWNMHELLPKIKSLAVKTGNWKTQFWQNLFLGHCDIWRDHRALLAGNELGAEEFARHFDGLRRLYDDRLEYERFKLGGEIDETAAAIARRLQFQID
jgi:erythronate-4-phosphate dehydrogenase